jgi:hypothetical protein
MEPVASLTPRPQQYTFFIQHSQKSFQVILMSDGEKVRASILHSDAFPPALRPDISVNGLTPLRPCVRRRQTPLRSGSPTRALRTCEPQFPPTPRTLPSISLPLAHVQCTLCNAKFSLILRRHHCRRCGKVVCANCGPKVCLSPPACLEAPLLNSRTPH